MYCTVCKVSPESHTRMINNVAVLSGLSTHPGILKLLDHITAPTFGVDPEVYHGMREWDCQKGTCGVIKLLPRLVGTLSAYASDILQPYLSRLDSETIMRDRNDLVEAYLTRIDNIGIIYDRARQLINKQATDDPYVLSNKYDLLNASIENSDGLRNLINVEDAQAIQLFMRHAPYLAANYAMVLVQDPQSQGILHNLKPEPKNIDNQIKDLEDIITHSRYQIRQLDPHRSWNVDFEERSIPQKELYYDQVLERRTQRIRAYSLLQHIRIGAMYIPKIHDTFSPVSEQINSEHEIAKINEEMSNLSLAVLHAASSTAQKSLSKLYGTPTSRYSLILGGANARKEFPSFDYDGFFVYEKDGVTEGKLRKGISHQEYFTKLFELTRQICTTAGMNFTSDFHETVLWTPSNVSSISKPIPGSDTTCHAVSLENYISLLKLPESEVQTLFMTYLIHGAGDKDFSNMLISSAHEKIKSGSHAYEAARLLQAREEEKKSNKSLNIKYSEGGLRDIFSVICLDNLIHSTFNPAVASGINRLPLTTRERDTLFSIYKSLLDIRIRMDFYYGRNEKTIPEDIQTFACSTMEYLREDIYAGDKFKKHIQRMLTQSSSLVEKAKLRILTKIPNLEQAIHYVSTEDERAEKKLEEIKSITLEKQNRRAKRKQDNLTNNLIGKGRDPFLSESWVNRFEGEGGFL